MRPRISWIALAMSLALGANVEFTNLGVVDIAISATLPGGAVSWGVWRLIGSGNVQLLGHNMKVPGE
jgi:hypothetical protein